AYHRHGLVGQRRKHQFAFFAVWHGLACNRIDDLGVEMVLPHDRAVFGLYTFHGDTRPHDLGQAIDVHGIQAGTAFDVSSPLAGPGLCTENPDLQRALVRIQALALHFFEKIAKIRWRDHDHTRAEIVDQLDLFFGLATGHGHHRTAQAFGAVMRTQPPG